MIRIAESVRPAFTPEQPHRPAWAPSEYVRFGKSGGYQRADGVNHLVWHGRESDGAYWITAPLTGGELIKIAQSVGSTQSLKTITGNREGQDHGAI